MFALGVVLTAPMAGAYAFVRVSRFRALASAKPNNATHSRSTEHRGRMSIFALHHMVPQTLEHHAAFNGVDSEAFGVQSLANKIYLPVEDRLAGKMGISVHRGPHPDVYVETVRKALDKIAAHADPRIREVKLKNLFDAMRIGFGNGDLHARIPDGMAPGEFQKRVERVIRDNEEYPSGHKADFRKLRRLEEEIQETGETHLLLHSAILGNANREKLAIEAIKSNPRTNVTAENRHLEGTPFSKFAAIDDDFETPPSTPHDPNNAPSLPPFAPPPVGWLSQPEGFNRSDPRFTGALPAFPQLDPNEQRLGQLPPTTATPSDPHVYLYDPLTGVPNPGSGPSPILNPGPLIDGTPPASLYVGAGLAALVVLFPAIWPYLAVIAAGYAATLPAHAAGSENGAASNGESVFTSGAAPFNAFSSVNPFSQAGAGSSSSPAHANSGEGNTPAAEGGSSFVDRFGAWIETPSGTMPQLGTADVPTAVTAGTVPLDEFRRLTRSNASNAGSVFASGDTPIPHLPSTKFDDRFGNWNVQGNGVQSGQTSKPTGGFSGEPSYVIPPPIFGVEGSASPIRDAELWFSRWIKPNLGPE